MALPVRVDRPPVRHHDAVVAHPSLQVPVEKGLVAARVGAVDEVVAAHEARHSVVDSTFKVR